MIRIIVGVAMEWLMIVFRMLIIYVLLIISLRVLGKREVGELSIFDLVIILIIADIASIGIDNPNFRYESYLCVVSLVVFQRIISMVSMRYARMRTVMDGTSRIIVLDGKLNIQNMKKERYNVDDLISQMRLEHIMNIDEIKLAILETNGTLSIFRNSQFDKVVLPLVTSGLIQDEALVVFEVSKADVEKWFRKLKLDLKEILYCSISKQGLLIYVSCKTDKESIPHKVEWKELE